MTAVATPETLGLIDGLPLLSGQEEKIQAATQTSAPIFLPRTNLRLQDVSAGFAIALHMHQPTIPAGPSGALINNLQYMFEHPYEGDNHNAGPFVYCYSRMGDFVPELIEQGCNPRVMLDYSGTLLWGLQQMRRKDVLDKLKRITCEAAYWPHVEWLGTFWGHAVAASTPVPDFQLHLRAWQHHFASLFGLEALSRVKGFSLPEMQLPNHPDTLYALIQALQDCGYRWLIVQEHTVETLAGGPISQPHLPHRLVTRNSSGAEISITALIKTQGSDTKLVGQMQPYYEAKTLSPVKLGEIEIPPLVTQISDGENGGVMMNEFPSAFKRAWHEMPEGGRAGTVGMNGTEYLELIAAAGVAESDFPTCQAVGQHRLWQQLGETQAAPETIAQAIAALTQQDDRFSMEGGSWTNDRSWVSGYQNVLGPMEQLSAQFHAAIAAVPPAQRAELTSQPAYRQALLHNLLLQTSCFRYWGQGAWTDYAKQIYEQGLSSVRQISA
ncbi:MAG: glycosyl hydrolase family 57 [Leptolyngbya sp. SIO4C1]|nr:glycosyl hydrolase family 57 [Leptolyngbya sp. SIO4C1]